MPVGYALLTLAATLIAPALSGRVALVTRAFAAFRLWTLLRANQQTRVALTVGIGTVTLTPVIVVVAVSVAMFVQLQLGPLASALVLRSSDNVYDGRSEIFALG